MKMEKFFLVIVLHAAWFQEGKEDNLYFNKYLLPLLDALFCVLHSVKSV